MTKAKNVIDPSKPYAAVVNREYAAAQGLSLAELYNQDRVAYPGDPNVGKMIPGTSILYEDATTVQYLIADWVTASGQSFDAFADDITSTPGPDEPANLPFSGWGLVMGKPMSSLLAVRSGPDVRTGNLVQIIELA